MKRKDWKLTDIVRLLLRSFPELREDDDLLIAEVYRFLGVSTESFADVMATRKRRGLPSFESIRRTRQKLQETEPSLRPGEEVQQIRKKEEVKYYDYAKGFNDTLA